MIRNNIAAAGGMSVEPRGTGVEHQYAHIVLDKMGDTLPIVDPGPP